MSKINWPDLTLPPSNLWVLVPAYKMKQFNVNTVHSVNISDKDWLSLAKQELMSLTNATYFHNGQAWQTERFRGNDEEICLGPMSDLDKAIQLVIKTLEEKYNGKG